MKKKDKYKRMKQDTRTDRDSLTSRMKKGKVSPYPGETGASADLFDTKNIDNTLLLCRCPIHN